MSYRVEAKWGDAAKVGFSQIPDTLLKAQSRLGVDPVEMNVLFNLISFWWLADKLPFPSADAVAKRMGVQSRTVRRALLSLVDKGLIQRQPITGFGPSRYEYDLSPLVEAVERLARRDPRFEKEVVSNVE